MHWFHFSSSTAEWARSYVIVYLVGVLADETMALFCREYVDEKALGIAAGKRSFFTAYE